MKTYKLAYPEKLIEENIPKAVAAIGFFDGIHKGHQEVINTAVSKAQKDQMESAVITFYPHPSVVLKGNEQAKYITPLHIKQDILQQLNIDRLYVIEFNKELSLLSPREFIEHFIVGLNVKHVVAGFDFTFGHKGKGNMENILQLGKNNFTTSVIEKVQYRDEKISSTNVRKHLASGKVAEANTLLGRHYCVSGTVVSGDQRGRTIGYPTANIKTDPDTLLPKSGVYAVKVNIDNITYEGMANLGIKPTFHPHAVEPIIEVNIFDFNGDLYGKRLFIEWHTFIRDEKKFSTIDDLVSQIKQDEKDIRTYFMN